MLALVFVMVAGISYRPTGFSNTINSAPGQLPEHGEMILKGTRPAILHQSEVASSYNST